VQEWELCITVKRRPTSALGQKQTSDCLPLMSALPPKADIARRQLDVRFVPQADTADSFETMLCVTANSAAEQKPSQPKPDFNFAQSNGDL
jgi:hypothetical protein